MALRPTLWFSSLLLSCGLLAGCVAPAASEVATEAPIDAAAPQGNPDAGGALDAAGEPAAHEVDASPTVVTVLSTTPPSSAVDVRPDTVIAATFSEALAPSSLPLDSFVVSLGGAAGAGVTGTLRVEGPVVSFTPATPLEPATTYTATVGAGVTDSGHVALAAPVTWSFTTAAAPTVTVTSPLDGRVGVGTEHTVSVTFSVAMDPTTLTAQAQSGSCSGTFRVHDGDAHCVGGALASADNETFVFTPAAPLASERTHVVAVSSATSARGVSLVPFGMTGGFTTTRFATDARVLYESAMVAADFGGAASGDVVCTTAPGKPVGVESARAILSDVSRTACSVPNCGADNVQTNWALHPSSPYVRSDGTFLFTTDENGIFTSYPMAATFAGFGVNFWDALSPDWTSTPNNCANWTSAAYTAEDCSANPACGDVGWDAIAGDSWLTGGALPCSTPRPLACAEW